MHRKRPMPSIQGRLRRVNVPKAPLIFNAAMQSPYPRSQDALRYPERLPAKLCAREAESGSMAHQIGQMRLFQGATLPLRVPHQVHRPACRCTVVAKATKAADLRGLTTEDIQKQIYESKRALFDLRVAQKTRKVLQSFSFAASQAFYLLGVQ